MGYVGGSTRIIIIILRIYIHMKQALLIGEDWRRRLHGMGWHGLGWNAYQRRGCILEESLLLFEVFITIYLISSLLI